MGVFQGNYTRFSINLIKTFPFSPGTCHDKLFHQCFWYVIPNVSKLIQQHRWQRIHNNFPRPFHNLRSRRDFFHWLSPLAVLCLSPSFVNGLFFMVTNNEARKVHLLCTLSWKGLYIIYWEGGDASKKWNRFQRVISKYVGFYFGWFFFVVGERNVKKNHTVRSGL